MASRKPAKKSTKKTTRTVKKTKTPKKQKSIYYKIFDILRLGESYTSLALGIIAVIIATILLISFFSNRSANRPDQEIKPTIADVDELDIAATPSPEKDQISSSKTYTVIKGDTLWSIAEKTYGSGFNWIDIAKEIKLTNPGTIFAGNVLTLPSVKLKDATVVTGEDEAKVSRTVRIVEETYVVVKGDALWDIAVRSYADGYQWTKIAKANNLTNPNLIHSGNILKIPRN